MSQSPKLPENLEIWQATLSWQPNESQLAKFQALYAAILAGNRYVNLTRITEPTEFWEKHLWDSLAGICNLGIAEIAAKQSPISVIDIGTGAGFPGIPLAITFPFWTVTLLDSTQKKINFVSELIEHLQINNATILTGRAEVIACKKMYRENYQLATIRAVASASTCTEYALPLLKISGSGILYRGHWSQEENLKVESIADKLGGKIEAIIAKTTPLTNSIRHWVYLQKLSAIAK
jgi:16S rRNA (guanine527-N7)-methyltransferase